MEMEHYMFTIAIRMLTIFIHIHPSVVMEGIYQKDLLLGMLSIKIVEAYDWAKELF